MATHISTRDPCFVLFSPKKCSKDLIIGNCPFECVILKYQKAISKYFKLDADKMYPGMKIKWDHSTLIFGQYRRKISVNETCIAFFREWLYQVILLIFVSIILNMTFVNKPYPVAGIAHCNSLDVSGITINVGICTINA